MIVLLDARCHNVQKVHITLQDNPRLYGSKLIYFILENKSNILVQSLFFNGQWRHVRENIFFVY